MNVQQIALVRSTFALVHPIASDAAALFYANLFRADPALRELFQSDTTRQGQRLMGMIGSALQLLDRPAALLPVLRSLGARHAGFGQGGEDEERRRRRDGRPRRRDGRVPEAPQVGARGLGLAGHRLQVDARPGRIGDRLGALAALPHGAACRARVRRRGQERRPRQARRQGDPERDRADAAPPAEGRDAPLGRRLGPGPRTGPRRQADQGRGRAGGAGGAAEETRPGEGRRLAAGARVRELREGARRLREEPGRSWRRRRRRHRPTASH